MNTLVYFTVYKTKTSSPIVRPVGAGVAGGTMYSQILSDHLTLFQLGGADYAHQIIKGTPDFSDLPKTL